MTMRWVSLLLVALMLGTSISSTVTADPTTPDYSKMTSELIHELSNSDRIEAIIQFDQDAEGDLWRAIESTGAEIIGEMDVLDGGLISATSASIAEISRFSFVRHMEANLLIEHFFLPGDQNDVESMMHETVNVVNASLAWHRVIIGTDGIVKTESDLSFTEYDGEGATAVDLDTGIDGEHPDFDCGEPWSGEN